MASILRKKWIPWWCGQEVSFIYLKRIQRLKLLSMKKFLRINLLLLLHILFPNGQSWNLIFYGSLWWGIEIWGVIKWTWKLIVTDNYLFLFQWNSFICFARGLWRKVTFWGYWLNHEVTGCHKSFKNNITDSKRSIPCALTGSQEFVSKKSS